MTEIKDKLGISVGIGDPGLRLGSPVPRLSWKRGHKMDVVVVVVVVVVVTCKNAVFRICIMQFTTALAVCGVL